MSNTATLKRELNDNDRVEPLYVTPAQREIFLGRRKGLLMLLRDTGFQGLTYGQTISAAIISLENQQRLERQKRPIP